MVQSEILKQVPILQKLSQESLESLAERSTIRQFKKKTRIYETNDALTHVYFVIKGSVKLGSRVDDEKTLIKDIAYENDVFGENIFTGNRRTEFAETLKESSVVCMEIDAVKRLITTESVFANYITSVIIERISHLEQRMKNFIFLKAHKRIAQFLKRTGLQRGIRIGMDEVLINHGMSHKDISFLTDTSRQTVTRVLSELKSADFIHFSARKPSKILIRNMDML